MTIYILSEKHEETARFLDDKSLDRMIKDVAQVLCNGVRIHHNRQPMKFIPNIPLSLSGNVSLNIWDEWAIKYKANYLWLINLGIMLCNEHAHRFFVPDKIHPITKYENAILWARDNVPDLPIKTMSNPNCPKMQIECRDHLPLVMPEKYIQRQFDYQLCSRIFVQFDQAEKYKFIFYRNYYQAKLENSLKKCQTIGEYSGGKNSEVIGTSPSIIYKWTKREKPEWLSL